MNTPKANNSIERDLKLIGFVGVTLFLTLIGALLFVQKQMGASQTKLSELVVPTQRELGKLSGAVGSMFLRQSEVATASGDALPLLEDRSDYVLTLNRSQQDLTDLISRPEFSQDTKYPAQAASALKGDVKSFLQVDSDLFTTVSNYRALQSKLANSIEGLDDELRKLTEASGGLAGVIRLEYVSMLRDVSKQINRGEMKEESIRRAIVGDSRSQLSAIDQFDTAVLRLGIIAGKVGLATTDDVLNSLSANALIPNRKQIQSSITRVAKTSQGFKATKRVENLTLMVTQLIDWVGNETDPESLVSLRRQMLAEERHVHEIQESAARTAEELASHIQEIRGFTQHVASRAREKAITTVSNSRLVTFGVSLIGLLLSALAGLRVQKSIIALRYQNQQLQELSDDLALMNAGLEETVAQRTASLQLVLDSTGDGMVSVDLDGSLLPERSRSVTDWFGQGDDEISLWDFVTPHDDEISMSLEMGFDQIAADIFPFEVAVDQLPSRMTRDNRVFALEYREVEEEGKLARVLVMIRDITAQVEAEQAERAARELHDLLGNLLRDRDGFQQAIDECDALIKSVGSSSDSVLIKRGLHTIKGNCALLGFRRIAEYVHELESALAEEDDRDPQLSEHEVLVELWQKSLDSLSDYLETGREKSIEIVEADLEELTKMVLSRGSYEEIATLISSWYHESTLTPLNRLADKVRYVADRLNKPVDVSIFHGNLRLPPEPLKEFWSTMVHVVRNAIDHGLEESSAREEAGKPPEGQIQLMTRRNNQWLDIELSDDGRGIDWEALRTKGNNLGLATKTHNHLVNVLFHDGVSTKETATEISGRGVGLGAVLAACEQLDGTILVESTLGMGTKFTFRFPWAAFTGIDKHHLDRAKAEQSS